MASSPWPKDNQQALKDFYGNPTSEVEAQLIPVIPPFKMTYGGKPITSIKFHRKAASALMAALNEIWLAYGKDQTKIDADRVSIYDGSYNPRMIAGSNPPKWSNHAFGAAIDIDAAHNGFNTGHGTMPQRVINAFKRQGARWGGDYHGRTDPMHFEFVDAGPVDVVPPHVPSPDTPTPFPLPPTPPVLSVGSKGKDVELLQRLLFVDGIFGHETEEAVKDFQEANGLDIDGVVGPETWRKLLKDQKPDTPIVPPIIPVPASNRQMGITATVFGGAKDENESAYTGKLLNDTDLYIALPDRFEGVRPLVNVISPTTSVIVPIEDIGPWNTNDPYWETNSRPQAETYYVSKTPLTSGPNKGKVPGNPAGIDLSPALARRLSVEGKGKVDWQFYFPGDNTTVQPPPPPPDERGTSFTADWKDFDIWAWIKSKIWRT